MTAILNSLLFRSQSSVTLSLVSKKDAWYDSIFLNLLRLVSYPNTWSIFENVPRALEKNVCILLLLNEMLCIYLLST